MTKRQNAAGRLLAASTMKTAPAPAAIASSGLIEAASPSANPVMAAAAADTSRSWSRGRRTGDDKLRRRAVDKLVRRVADFEPQAFHRIRLGDPFRFLRRGTQAASGSTMPGEDYADRSDLPIS